MRGSFPQKFEQRPEPSPKRIEQREIPNETKPKRITKAERDLNFVRFYLDKLYDAKFKAEFEERKRAMPEAHQESLALGILSKLYGKGKGRHKLLHPEDLKGTKFEGMFNE